MLAVMFLVAVVLGVLRKPLLMLNWGEMGYSFLSPFYVSNT